MNVNYPKKKDVYYNNTVYKIPVEDLKHINGVDVVKLPTDLIIYWNDIDQKWKKADNSIIELYTNKKQIDVEFNGEIIKVLSDLDLYQEIENQSTTQVKIECLVILNKEKNTWQILDKNNELYKKYTENDKSK